MKQRIRVLRGGRRPARRPYRQGDLDGLCGVYSIVNAVHALCPELDQEGAGWLFAHLMESLNESDVDLSIAVTGGIGRADMGRLVRAAIAYIEEELEIRLTVKRLPKALRLTSNLGELWQAFEASLSPECVAIIGIAGIHSHWTIAARTSRPSSTLQMPVATALDKSTSASLSDCRRCANKHSAPS